MALACVAITDRPMTQPVGVARALQIGVEIAPAARAPDAVGGDAQHRAEQDHVVEQVHANTLMVSSTAYERAADEHVHRAT